MREERLQLRGSASRLIAPGTARVITFLPAARTRADYPNAYSEWPRDPLSTSAQRGDVAWAHHRWRSWDAPRTLPPKGRGRARGELASALNGGLRRRL
jgi:hypothetical protein